MKKFTIFYKFDNTPVEVLSPNFFSLYRFMGVSFIDFWGEIINRISKIEIDGVEINKYKWHKF